MSKHSKVSSIDQYDLNKELLTTLLLSIKQRKKEANKTTLSVMSSIVVFSILYLLMFLYNIFSIDENVLKISSCITSIIGTLSLTYIVFFLVKDFILGNKLKSIADLFEIDNKAEDSSFNDYIQEIIILIKKSKYKTIVFEDLDRYDDSVLIISQLKEINNILNKSKSFKFIYSLSDTTFETPVDKAKFFDAIITTSYVLSFEMLKKEINRISEEINENFPYILKNHINDMRVLISIRNDYHYFIDRGCLEKDKNKIFAIAVYKNLYPEDFNKLYLKTSIIDNILEDINDISHDKSSEEIKNSILKCFKDLKTSESKIFIPNNLENNKQTIKNVNHAKLLYDLLRYRYINSRYFATIYKESDHYLTDVDIHFILNLLDDGKMIFDYRLENVSAVFQNMNEEQFDKPAAVNYDLINYLYIIKDFDTSKIKESINKHYNDATINEIVQVNIIEKGQASNYLSMFIYNENTIDLINKVDNESSNILFVSSLLDDDLYKRFKQKNVISINELLSRDAILKQLSDFKRDEVIKHFIDLDVKVKNMTLFNDFVSILYKNSLFELNEININNYIFKKYNNDQKNQLTHLLNDEDVSQYIKNNFPYYIENIWLANPKIENSKTILFVVRKVNDENLLIRIKDNTDTRIENLMAGNFEDAKLKLINKLGLMEINIKNLNYINQHGKFSIEYEKITKIVINDENLAENILVDLINKSNLNSEDLFKLVEFNKFKLVAKIKNDDLFYKLIKNKYIDDVNENIVILVVSNGLHKTYRFLLENYLSIFNFKNSGYILNGEENFILKKLTDTNSSIPVVELVSNNKEFFDYYDYKDKDINKFLITNRYRYTKIPTNLMIGMYKNIKNIELIYLSIERDYLTSSEIMQILTEMGHPYNQFSYEKSSYQNEELNIRFINLLHDKKIIKKRINSIKKSHNIEILRKKNKL
ncbi:MAG: hypothetical protein WC225_03525 [Acholeplasmataceae bacterium]|nr:hypothetical protein [Acholeplasmataceae bacterium]